MPRPHQGHQTHRRPRGKTTRSPSIYAGLRQLSNARSTSRRNRPEKQTLKRGWNSCDLRPNRQVCNCSQFNYLQDRNRLLTP